MRCLCIVRVFCVVFVYRRLDVLFVIDCVMLYGAFVALLCVCVFFECVSAFFFGV